MATRSPRKTDIPHAIHETLKKHLEYCLGCWKLDHLVPEIEMRLSTRMTRTIGSANLTKNRMTFAVWLFDQPQAVIDEVLCHEAAHLAVHHLYGQGVRPHGREWQALMSRAGVMPRVRIPLPNPPPLRKPCRRRRKTVLGRAAALIRW